MKQKIKLDRTDKAWIILAIVSTFILIIANLQLNTIGGW